MLSERLTEFLLHTNFQVYWEVLTTSIEGPLVATASDTRFMLTELKIWEKNELVKGIALHT